MPKLVQDNFRIVHLDKIAFAQIQKVDVGTSYKWDAPDVCYYRKIDKPGEKDQNGFGFKDYPSAVSVGTAGLMPTTNSC